MPTYDYECLECGHVFEQFQKMSDPPLTECPACGGSVRRLIGGGLGVIFKGSGFYVTDNKNSGKAALSSKDSGGNGSKESKGAESPKPADTKKEQPAAT
ncbi:MAG: zinc ribbon domain-containing protein [Spirochaetales bacterium]|nr:zinc ribbon domain-containing protein [Spirochaetales bacterium]